MATSTTGKSTLLTWYPHSPTEWRRIVRGLTLEEQGALASARDEAWDSEDHPACLVDADDAWARLLGRRWRQLLPTIRRFFSDPAAGGPGLVCWPWLHAMWQAQSGRYTRRATAGHSGGRESGATRRRRRSNASSDGEALLPEMAKQPRSNASSKVEATGEANAKHGASRVELDGDVSPGLTARGRQTPGGDAPLAGAGGPGASPPDDGAPAARNGHDPDDATAERPSILALFAAEVRDTLPPLTSRAVRGSDPPPEAPPRELSEADRAELAAMIERRKARDAGAVATLEVPESPAVAGEP